MDSRSIKLKLDFLIVYSAKIAPCTPIWQSRAADRRAEKQEKKCVCVCVYREGGRKTNITWILPLLIKQYDHGNLDHMLCTSTMLDT